MGCPRSSGISDSIIGPKGKVPFGPFYVKIHIEFYSLLYIIKIKGSNMKIDYIMGCFHKQKVTSDYECAFH